jgi:hypothetical protein
LRYTITTFLVALVTMGDLVVPVQGGNISGTISGDSTLTATGTPGVFVQNFTGDGDDTTFGTFTPTSQSRIDFSKPPAILISNGMFLETFSQGTLFGTSSGSGTANDMGSATVAVDFVFTGGTGLFTGAKGEATITGTITTTSPTTESINGSYIGTLSVVPEPSSLALLVTAIAVGAVSAVCKRRREAMRRQSSSRSGVHRRRRELHPRPGFRKSFV